MNTQLMEMVEEVIYLQLTLIDRVQVVVEWLVALQVALEVVDFPGNPEEDAPVVVQMAQAVDSPNAPEGDPVVRVEDKVALT